MKSLESILVFVGEEIEKEVKKELDKYDASKIDVLWYREHFISSFREIMPDIEEDKERNDNVIVSYSDMLNAMDEDDDRYRSIEVLLGLSIFVKETFLNLETSMLVLCNALATDSGDFAKEQLEKIASYQSLSLMYHTARSIRLQKMEQMLFHGSHGLHPDSLAQLMEERI